MFYKPLGKALECFSVLARTDVDSPPRVKVYKLGDVRMPFPAGCLVYAYASYVREFETAFAPAYPMAKYRPYTIWVFLDCLGN